MKAPVALAIAGIVIILIVIAVAVTSSKPMPETQPTPEPTTEPTPINVVPTPGENGTCEDTCGDGQCAEVVCLAIGCPCAETPASCPQDCPAQ